MWKPWWDSAFITQKYVQYTQTVSMNALNVHWHVEIKTNVVIIIFEEIDFLEFQLRISIERITLLKKSWATAPIRLSITLLISLQWALNLVPRMNGITSPHALRVFFTRSLVAFSRRSKTMCDNASCRYNVVKVTVKVTMSAEHISVGPTSML